MKEFLAKISIGNMIAGAVVILVLGFQSGVLTTQSSARAEAANAARSATQAILTPLCVAAAKADPNLEARLAELKATSAYSRVTKFEEFGWANVPGTDKANRDVARLCMDEVLV